MTNDQARLADAADRQAKVGLTPASRPALFGGSTMGSLLIEALERYPHRPAFIDGDKTTTYADLALQVGRAIALLDGLGLRPGDLVAQLSGNKAAVYALIAAIYVGGYRSATLQAMGSLDDHAYILEDAEAKVLVVDPAHADRGREIQARLGASVKVYCNADDDTLPNFWREAEAWRPRPLRARGQPEDIIRLAYTGGTTGRPKGVMLSNRALVTNTVLVMAGLDWPEEPRFLCPTPISHGAGALILPTLLRGGVFILHNGFSAERVLEAIERDRITNLFLVPTMIYAILDHPRSRQVDYSSLHSLLYGAAPMAPARVREALDLFGPVLCQGYGQTEAPNAILTLSRADHLAEDERRLASAGRPYAGIDVRLLDDQDQEVERGQVGELCVRGPLVMSGYWKQPELTAEALRNDWLHTGDMALQDEQGFFYLVDRKKDLIISGGFNVFPGEIENVLMSHPAVLAAGVIGVPDPKWGEAVKAIVVLRSNSQVSAENLIQLVKTRKGAVNAPKSVEFVETLPLTALGKLDKKALRARFWGGAERNIN
jgi:fatty-acyl-CoA synthase